MKPIPLFIFLMLIVSNTQAQQWVNYLSSGNTFSGHLMTGVCIDNVGNRYFGTQDSGILKFDGVNWTVFNTLNSPLRNDAINSAFTDNQGNLWFGTYNGAYKFDGNTWAVYDTTTPHPYGNGNAISLVYDVAIDSQGKSWLGTFQGAIKLEDTGSIFYDTTNSGIADNTVRAVAVDKQNHKWFATFKGISEFNDTVWTNYIPDSINLLGRYPQAILVDRLNNKWFGTQFGVNKFDGNHWTNYTKSNSGLINNYIEKIREDQFSNIWFTTGGGVSKFDGNSTWTSYDTTNSGISYNWVVDLAFDTSGNAWFATYGNGISELLHTPTLVQGSVYANQLISIYPNPANGICSLSMSGLSQMQSATIFDATGRQILSLFDNQQLTSFNFSTALLSSGLYLIRITDNTGKMGVVKLVKE